jgi:TP901 family phage tail tape measure protein
MAISLPIVSSFDNRGLRRAKDALRSFGNFAADIGKIAAGAVTAVAVAGVREAAQFETSIAKIEGLVGVGGEALDELAGAARRLGPETGRSAQEAADALFVITSAGLRGADAVEALELSLKASTAGLGETQDIARSVAGAMNAYGAETIDAAKATDVIVATARAGNFETSQFASAIGRVLPFAQQAGASLEDMGGAVALLTRTNGDAAQSVTQVSSLFRAFVIPTEQAKTALQNVGLSAEDMRTAIAEQGLPAALDMLEDKLGGNREELGRLLGSSEAASAAFQILDADSGTLAETFGVVNDATGITNEAFNVAADTASVKFAQAMGTARESLLVIGEDLLERLIPHLETFGTFMEENGPRIEEVFTNIFDVVERVAEGVGEFITKLAENEEFQTFLTNMGDWFAETWPVVEDLVTQLGNLAIALTPLLTDTIETALPFLRDLASVLSNILFFSNEITESLKDMGIEVPPWVAIIEQAISPVDRLRAVFAGLAEALDRARRAWEKFVGAGAPEELIPGPVTDQNVRLPAPQTRATGGPVQAGQSYLIGERGAEMFVPRQDGSIVPNHRLGGGGGGGIYITVNAGMGTNGPQVGEEIVAAIKRYERSSGRVFASA